MRQRKPNKPPEQRFQTNVKAPHIFERAVVGLYSATLAPNVTVDGKMPGCSTLTYQQRDFHNYPRTHDHTLPNTPMKGYAQHKYLGFVGSFPSGRIICQFNPCLCVSVCQELLLSPEFRFPPRHRGVTQKKTHFTPINETVPSATPKVGGHLASCRVRSRFLFFFFHRKEN